MNKLTYSVAVPRTAVLAPESHPGLPAGRSPVRSLGTARPRLSRSLP